MAYNLSKLKAEAKPRYAVHTAGPNLVALEAISQGQLQFLNNNLDFLEKYGINLDENKKAPKRNGVPSMFILQKDPQGVEKQVDISEAGIEIGSAEFWYQAQLGNLFVYPAGSANPSQLSVELHEGRPKLNLSKPIEPEDIPVQQKVKMVADEENPEKLKPVEHVYRRPNWFTRAINKVFKNFRKEDCEIYREKESLKKTFDDVKKLRNNEKTLDGELKQVLSDEAIAQDKREQEEISDKMKFLQIQQNNKVKGKQVYRDHTAPTPVYHKEYLLSEGGSNYYTKEIFDELDVIDKKYEDYSVGGKTISEDEYTGLVAACSMLPKNGLPGLVKSDEYDPTAVQTYVNLGYDRKKAEEIAVNAAATLLVTDHMKGNLRAMQGNVLGLTVNPARKNVFEILEQYKQGNKAPLAEAIARGIAVAIMDTGNRADSVGANIYNHTDFANATIDLLDRDPELKKIAMDKYGLEQGDYEAVKGMSAMSKADDARTKAQITLADATLKDLPLTKQEKQKLAEDIITANLMESKMFEENFLQKQESDPHAKETDRLYKEAKKNNLQLNKEQLLFYSQHPEQRPLPPKGKLYQDQVNGLMAGLLGDYNVHPDTVLEVSDAEGVEGMKKIAAKIVEKEGLADLDLKDLNKALVMDKHKYMGTELVMKGQEAVMGGKKTDPEALERQRVKEIEEGEIDPLNKSFMA